MTAQRVHTRRAGDPLVVVCAGGGGVGKTTTSAALALGLARQGRSTLIVTIDPARRLASAMGVALSDAVTTVPFAGTNGRLAALMPDPRRSMHAFVDQLFEGEPAARERLRDNRVYQGLADAAAGVHELVALNLVAAAASTGSFEVVVIDTAPSRQAIDFVTLPGRLAALLGGKTVAWLSGLATRSGEKDSTQARSGGLLAWGKGHLEHLIARAAGPYLVRDTAGLFIELALVRERFVHLTERASALLLGDRAAYVLVAAPTAAARDDVIFLAKRLEKLGRAPRALLMNRADTRPAPYVTALRSSANLSPALSDALDVLDEERKARGDSAAAMTRDLSRQLPSCPLIRLPFVEAYAAADVVHALSLELEAHHRALLPQ
ncbi:MAG: AAA family ATPase [Polyangiaceae bacterium]|nr:AAA family ATPase [Polyangiaceae bacterium]